jgi:hypothetical protein
MAARIAAHNRFIRNLQYKNFTFLFKISGVRKCYYNGCGSKTGFPNHPIAAFCFSGIFQQFNFIFNAIGFIAQKNVCGFIEAAAKVIKPARRKTTPNRPKASMSLWAICISRQMRQSSPVQSWSCSAMTKTPAKMTANASQVVVKAIKKAVFRDKFAIPQGIIGDSK